MKAYQKWSSWQKKRKEREMSEREMAEKEEAAREAEQRKAYDDVYNEIADHDIVDLCDSDSDSPDDEQSVNFLPSSVSAQQSPLSVPPTTPPATQVNWSPQFISKMSVRWVIDEEKNRTLYRPKP